MKTAIMWFRRDLRLEDNAALYHALKGGLPVIPVFIFDKNILAQLKDRYDKRVQFIHRALQNMQEQLVLLGSSLHVLYGYPAEIFHSLIQQYDIGAVYANHDYDPYAQARDTAVSGLLASRGIAFCTSKDYVIFEKDEVLKDDGKPHMVFTPYSKKWMAGLDPYFVRAYPSEKYSRNFYKCERSVIPSLNDIGFKGTAVSFPSEKIPVDVIGRYDRSRDFPAAEHGTSRMGVHLRFGTVSIRKLASIALSKNRTYLNELIWREFYQMILCHFPRIGKGFAFKQEYDKIPWRNNETEFERWCDGTTGYPIVDAGMRELNETGYMHNRVRMITASFLAKHLLIDWRWGEAYFAQKLLDYEFASNNGGWQWASGSGCDAVPYFRIFNPALQQQKFDKDGKYVRRWLPELGTGKYPAPMVPHEFARNRALEVYKKALNS